MGILYTYWHVFVLVSLVLMAQCVYCDVVDVFLSLEQILLPSVPELLISWMPVAEDTVYEIAVVIFCLLIHDGQEREDGTVRVTRYSVLGVWSDINSRLTFCSVFFSPL
jgi:hypothetical protein